MPRLGSNIVIVGQMPLRITLENWPIFGFIYFRQKKPTDGIAEPGGLKLGYAITST